MEKESDNKSNLPQVLCSSSIFCRDILLVHLSCKAASYTGRYSDNAYCFGEILLRMDMPLRLIHGFAHSNPKGLKIRYRNLSDKLNKLLHNLRYALVLLFLGLAPVLYIIDSHSTSEALKLMALGLAGVFEPMYLLLGPLVPLIVPWEGPLEIGGLYFSFPYVREVMLYSGENFATLSALIFLALVVVSSFFIRRGWCRFCPTGCSIAALNRLRGFEWAPVLHLDKNETKCTKCGICKRVCPVQVTEVYEQKGGKIMTSMCMLCFRCVEMCPYEDCLRVNLGGKTVFKSRNWLEPSEVE